MEMLWIFVGICVLIYCDGAQQCRNEECNSKRGKQPVTCVVEDIPEDGKIVSIEIIEEKRKSRCIEYENYGFNTKSIWVSDKCSAEFKVCFFKDIDEDFSTTTVKITSTRNYRNPSIRSTLFPGIFSRTTPAKIPTSTRANRETTDKVKYVTPTYTTNSTHGNRTSQVDKILTAGILGGVVGGLIFLLLVLILCVVILRRFSCFKRKYDQHYNNGHRNITTTVSQVTTVTNGDNEDGYDTLGIYSGGRNHQYDACSPVRFDQPHNYMTVYDSLEPPKIPPNNNRPTNLENNARVHVRPSPISRKEMKIGDYIDLTATEEGSDRSQILKVSTKNKYKSDFHETKDLNATNYELAKPIPKTQLYEPQQYELAKPAANEIGATSLVLNSVDTCNDGLCNISGESNNKCENSANNLYSHPEDFYYVTPQQNGGTRKTDHANYELWTTTTAALADGTAGLDNNIIILICVICGAVVIVSFTLFVFLAKRCFTCHTLVEQQKDNTTHGMVKSESYTYCGHQNIAFSEIKNGEVYNVPSSSYITINQLETGSFRTDKEIITKSDIPHVSSAVYFTLDPVETGYDRRLASPICDEVIDDDPYIETVDDIYDHAHRNRHKSITSNDVYDHSVDDTYDVADHIGKRENDQTMPCIEGHTYENL
ncbi:unnamed protein product [Mytilus coruscus]|uniref:Uncharacterized protein n=1 Tax=Mytilus coruscus TaxID=42192 RepID=A0A6J8C4D0_MYTCO|nr:unnamed protein product [Mytilus coruscus]